MKTSLKTFLFGHHNRIDRRLIVLVVAFSSLITLVISVTQLALEYRGLRSGMDQQLDSVSIYVPTLAASVWDFDEKQIQRSLDALALLPHVIEAKVVSTGDGRTWSATRTSTPNVVVRHYPLRHAQRGEEIVIGRLTIVASLDAIYQQIVNIALGIIMSNAIKTLLVVMFMIALIRRLITARLERIADRLRILAPDMLPFRAAVEKHAEPMPEHLDEIDAVDWTLQKTGEDLKVAVSALNALNAELEQRVLDRTKELESFSYSVSHDLRTPLRAIDGFSKILIEDYQEKLDDEGRRVVDVIRANTQRMGQLIDDMLQFSRMGRQEINCVEVDLAGLANTVFADLKPVMAERDLRFAVGDLPTVSGDPAMLRQVLENLLSNAIKFTRPRSPGEISLYCTLEDGMAVFCVRDNGVGFDMRYVDKLFGVFERLHANHEFEGTGIGLAIVRKVIARHGGRTWAESVLGEGAAMFFTLPLMNSGEVK